MTNGTYNNPESMNPGTGWKPRGFLGGMAWSKDRRRYEEMAPIVDEMSRLSMEDQRAKLADYLYGAAARQSGYDLTSAGNKARLQIPGYFEQGARGEMGLAQSQQATGAHDLATLPSRIGATQSTNETTPFLNQQKRAEAQTAIANQPNLQLGNVLQFIDRASTMFGPDLQGQTAYQQFRQALPPQMQQQLPPTYGPDAQARIKQIRDYINQAAIREEEKNRLDRESRENVARIGAQGGIQQAQVRLAGKAKSVEDVLRSSKDDEAFTRNYKWAIQDPEVGPMIAQKYGEAYKEAENNLTIKRATGYQPPISPKMPGVEQAAEAIRRAKQGQQAQPGNKIDFNRLP